MSESDAEFTDSILKLIPPQLVKFAGLTADGWEQLRKHPYISVSCEDFSQRFLNNVTNINAIINLLPDDGNMTRTDLDLPDGIEIEVTFQDNHKEKFTTKYTPFETSPKNTVKHHRILGVSDE